MAIIDIDGIIDSVHGVEDALQRFANRFFKALQVLVDGEAPDPDANNADYVFTIPQEFYAQCYCRFYANEATTDYNSYSSGTLPVLFCFDLSLDNGILQIENMECLGKLYTGSGYSDNWRNMTEAQKADCVEQVKNYFLGNLEIESDYPTEKDIFTYNSGTFSFRTENHSDSLHFKYTTLDGQQRSVRLNAGMKAAEYIPSLDTDTDLISPSYNNFEAPRSGTGFFVTRPFQCITRDESWAINIVSTNGAVHNYVDTHTTAQGTFKVYYGDNYIIYYIPASVPLSYNVIKNVTVTAANKINSDNPSAPPIEIKTYEENKYGPPPEDPDADIEVEMDLNDAAYGAGMSHYYVTTTTSGVLDDISAAMSTWDIKNTGKDLYRNLLSCRLTKVGPIPAENSTFVIYGEELQYNGAPITISKITGNPSMDLGEYEILPKFNDFRDYAPYTKIEMYIPYCGWVALPSHCMSSEEDPKIITGTLLCDIIAGTCKAVIKCNDTVVAEAAGFTAVDVPFVGENVGMKMAGIASSITSYGSGAAKTVGGIAGGMSGGGPAGAAAAGGVVSLLGSYAQLNAAFNANYTEICGKTGDGCNVAGLNKVYIKIQRPKTGGFEEPDFVPGDYGHTTGFLCMQKLKVSDCSGLIIAANADVSGIGSATDAERAEIKRVLETGLFVNSPPEPGE